MYRRTNTHHRPGRARILAATPLRALTHPAVLVALALAAFFAIIAPSVASAEDYRLGPQDKIRLKIYEWRASRDEIFEWDALNDTFTVAADGTVSLPFAGKLRAEGLAPTELAEKVSSALMQRMDLGRSPDVSAEIVEYRPFYIVGDVQTPGAFPFRPDLTVLQAVSIGGGLRRQPEDSRIEREVISSRGELAVQQVSRDGLLARKARLEAEVNGDAAITFPEELTSRTDQTAIATIMAQEKAIFEARQQGLETQVRALEELRDFLDTSANSLEAHVAFQDRQVALAQKEMQNVEELAKKGFAAESRKMDVERSLVQAQSDRLSAESSLLSARQEKSRAEISMLELNINRKNEVRAQLRETEDKLQELERKSATTTQLLRESEIMAPEAAAKLATGGTREPVYTIVRAGGGGAAQKFEAGEAEPLRPGDVLRVEVPLESGGLGLPGVGRDLTLDVNSPLPQQTN